jgi:hypothetical protein
MNLSTQQLSYIGAIALLYNDVEALLDDMCATALGTRVPRDEVVSRINGVEGRLALLKQGARYCGFSDSEMSFLENVLGDSGFKLLKKWRDAVIHAQVLDAPKSVGKVNERQGRVSEVLLSLEALKGLFARLDFMRIELRALKDALSKKITLMHERTREWDYVLCDQDKARLESKIQHDWFQAQSHQIQRLSLPPIPEFPEDTPESEWLLKALENLSENLELNAGLSPKR